MTRAAALAGVVLAGCAGDGPAASVSVDAATAADLRAVAALRVWFGHHSVGRDVLDGVAALSAEAGVPVRIGESPVGRNQHPLEKIADFETQAIASDADVVLMKLCFVDFAPDTDVDALFATYRDAVTRIHAARPGVVVVHVTPPLYVRTVDVKSRLKRALGRPVWGDAANAKRAAFAADLRAAYAGEPMFDLARVESTDPQGTPVFSVVDGKPVPSLWPGYSSDGGHLNDAGKRAAARAFLRTLARVTPPRD